MPRGLPKSVKKCLDKAIDSAMLAVETYNKPAVKFKSGGFIVLMVIAWTALFHAIFFKRKIKPYYREPNNRFKRRDGDFLYWELSTCLTKYFQNQNSPIKANLEFFIPLRNMVEHKSIPEIDSDIFAECQALILNFDKIMEQEFGLKYCIRESLSFAIQLFPSGKSLNSALISNPSNKPIVDFIKAYRSSISDEVINSGQYSFKAFLIQVANHQSKAALPIQFVKYDSLDDAQKHNVQRVAALVKNRFVQVPVSNKDLLKPSNVVQEVQIGTGSQKVIRNGSEKDRFNMDTHTRCWKKYEVRPESGSENPALTTSEYCVYDQANETYLYTQEWVEFLIEQMSSEEEYNSLYI